MKALKIALISSFVFSFLFALFSVVFYFGDWTRLTVVSFLGFFTGLIAAPEIDPKAFKSPRLLQLLSGLVAGLITGLLFDLNPINLILTTLVGGLSGWSARSG